MSRFGYTPRNRRLLRVSTLGSTPRSHGLRPLIAQSPPHPAAYGVVTLPSRKPRHEASVGRKSGFKEPCLCHASQGKPFTREQRLPTAPLIGHFSERQMNGLRKFAVSRFVHGSSTTSFALFRFCSRLPSRCSRFVLDVFSVFLVCTVFVLAPSCTRGSPHHRAYAHGIANHYQ